MKKFKKYILGILAIFVCIFFNSNMVLADSTDVKDMGSKTITDTKKVWTVSFKKAVDISSVSNNIKISDITSGTNFTPTVSQGDDEYSIKVNPASGGYVVGHEYQLILNKDIKSQEGENLPKDVLLTFYVVSGSDKNYDVSANVIVSPFLSMLKKVTLSSEDLPQDAKYKIEGTNKLFNIGDTAIFVGNESTVNVYFYNSDGATEIGTGVLDVSSTNSNVDIEITN